MSAAYFKEQFKLRMLTLEHSKASDFYLSCWQTTRSPVPLLIFRGLLFLTSLAIVLTSISFYIQAGVFGYWLIYLTHWGITLNLLATGYSVAVSARSYIYGPIASGAEYSLPWYVKVFWVLYNIAVPLAFLITVFYWTLLYGAGVEEEFNHALDVAVHGLNSIVMFLLLVTSSHQSRLVHAVHPLALALCYVFFGIIYHLAGGVDTAGNRYVYFVVDWSSPGPTLGVVLLTGLLLLVLHVVVVGLSAARDALAAALVKPSVTVHVEEGVPLRRRPIESNA